jgi:hypothetical protein
MLIRFVLVCALLVVPICHGRFVIALVVVLVDRICRCAGALVPALPSLVAHICNIFGAPFPLMRDDGIRQCC